MKKKLRWEDSELDFCFSGMSTERGISIRAEKGKDEKNGNCIKIMSTRYPAAIAFLNDDGIIEIDPEVDEETQKKIEEQYERYSKTAKKVQNGFKIFAIVCYLSMIPAVLLNSYLPTFVLALAFISLGCTKIASHIYEFVKVILKDKDTIQSFKFHAAEHAVINAYYDLKRVPTIEEIKNYSSFTYGCSVARDFREAWGFLMIGFCRFIPDFWFLIAVAICLIFSKWADKQNFFFTEAVALSEPTDFEYDAAIRCMESALEKKKKIDELMPGDLPIIFAEITNGEGSIPVFSVHIRVPEDVQDDD